MEQRRHLILLLIFTIAITACSGIPVQPTSTLVNRTDPTLAPVSNTPTLPPTPSRTAAPPTATPRVATQTPSLTPTDTSTPTPTVPPFYQTPTFDPATIATITKAPAALCPAVNRDLKPVLPDQGEPAAFGYVDEMFHLQNDILDALNQGASLSVLQKALTTVTGAGNFLELSPGDLYQQDLTGDGVPEVVFFNSYYRFAIFSCLDGQYVLALDMPSDGRYSLKQLSVEDLNRDRLPEIVVSVLDFVSVVRCIYVFVFRWDGAAFQDLILSEHGDDFYLPETKSFSFCETGQYEIKDVDQNGLKEIVIQEEVGHHAESPLFGPWRQITNIVAWNGAGFALLPPRFTPPVYRFQAVQDGDRAFQRWDFEEALKLYQQVLDNRNLKGWSEDHFKQMQNAVQIGWQGKPTPKPYHPDDNSDYPTLAAYARFKILLIHLAQGKVDQAREEYESLQQDFPQGQPGSGFAGMAKAFWDEYANGHGLASGCARAEEYAEGHDKETSDQIDATWHGWQSPEYISEMDMCPFK